MKDKIHIVYCADKNYLMPTLVSATSAVVHASVPIVVHLICDNVDDYDFSKFENKIKSLKRDAQVVRHEWKSHDFDASPQWHGSRVIYARLLLPEILPKDVDWAVSLDGDTLWLGDVAELMRMKREDLLFQASIDPPPPLARGKDVQMEWFNRRKLNMPELDRLCVGLMLLNLKKMRSWEFSRKCIEFLKEFPDPPYPEQMVMCYIGQGAITPLPKQWGLYSVHHIQWDVTKPCCIHFVQDAPWRRNKLVDLMSDIVMVWHDFTRIVMNMDMLAKMPFWQRAWRRCAFLVFKENKWIKRIHPMLNAYLENVDGLSKGQMRELKDRFIAISSTVEL